MKAVGQLQQLESMRHIAGGTQTGDIICSQVVWDEDAHVIRRCCTLLLHLCKHQALHAQPQLQLEMYDPPHMLRQKSPLRQSSMLWLAGMVTL
jgi:hypothetical protein